MEVHLNWLRLITQYSRSSLLSFNSTFWSIQNRCLYGLKKHVLFFYCRRLFVNRRRWAHIKIAKKDSAAADPHASPLLPAFLRLAWFQDPAPLELYCRRFFERIGPGLPSITSASELPRFHNLVHTFQPAIPSRRWPRPWDQALRLQDQVNLTLPRPMHFLGK